MLFEDLLILALFGIATFSIAIPGYKFVISRMTNKRDALKEARKQLEIAQAEVEAAKIQRQIEHLYEGLYKETLEDDTETHNKKGA